MSVSQAEVSDTRRSPMSEDVTLNQGQSRLHEEDVGPLVEVLAKYAAKWKDIGLHLGFIEDELNGVHPGQQQRAIDYLRSMLNEWVHWTPKTSHGKYATLEDLKKALCSDIVNLGNVAEKLEEEIQERKAGKDDHQFSVKKSVVSTETFLLIACSSSTCDLSLVKQMLSFGVSVNYQNELGEFPLMKAVENAELVQILCKHGADVDKTDKDGRSALMHASRKGKPESVRTLVKYQAKLDTQENSTGYSPLIMATELGYIDTVRTLLECGAPVDQQDNEDMSALGNASMIGRNEILELLLHYKADAKLQDKKGKSALMYAASNGHIETVKILTKCPDLVCQRDNDGMSALMHAASKGHIETVKILIKHGAKVNEQSNDGKSALMHATCNGRTKTVSILVQHGAKVNLADDKGVTPLLYAQNHAEIATFLQKNGAQDSLFSNGEGSRHSNERKQSPDSLIGIDSGPAPSIKQKLTNSSQHSPPPTMSSTLKILLPLSDDWEDIGILLGLNVEKLEVIEKSCERNRDRLRKMIFEWLNLETSNPTWQVLAVALASLTLSMKKSRPM